MHDNERFALFPDQAHPSASRTPTLDQMGIDLTAQARQGKLAPVIGRDKDLEGVIQVLSRSQLPHTGIRKHNIALIMDLISEPERSLRNMAIVEGLAQQMIASRASAAASESVSAALESSWLWYCLEKLQGKRLVTLDVSLLVAGTTSQSEFEERFRTIIDELRSSQECIIFIDEVNTLVAFAQSAYGAAQSGVNVAPLPVSAQARGDMQCIGATTLDEYRTYIERDPALQRHFQEVILHEMFTTDETVLNHTGDNDSTQDQG